jgi:hypothetical protein
LEKPELESELAELKKEMSLLLEKKLEQETLVEQFKHEA